MRIARVWLCAYSLHGSRRAKAQVSASAHSYHLSAIHGERLIVCCLCPRSVFLRVPFCLLPFLFHTLPALWPALLLPCGQRQGKHLLRLRITRSIAPWRHPPTVYEPKLLDDFHCSETTEMIFQEESGDKDTEPSYLCDAELDDETIKKVLSSPLFIQERGEPADRRQAYHSYEESLLPASVLFHTHTRTVRPVHELSSCRQNQVAKWKTKPSGFSLKDKKEQIVADFWAEIHKHEFQADSDGRSIQELNGIIESQRREIDHTHATDEQLRREFSEQNRDLREAHEKNLNELEELKRFPGSTFDEFSRRRLIEDQDTINELTARSQEQQNEANCLNDSRDCKDAESVRSGLSHVPSQPALLPPFRDPGWMPSRNNGPPSIWDTHGISGIVFANPTASSSSPYPGGFNPRISNVSEHTSPHVMSESQTPAQDQRCQSGPSARNSFKILKELWSRPTTTADFGSSFWQIHHTSNIRLLEDKIQDWGMYLFTISNGSYAVDQRSGDGWISGWSKIFAFYKRNSNARFDVLDEKIASALNRIIHNSHFKRRISLEEMKAQKEDLFLRGRQIAYLIYECFRVTEPTVLSRIMRTYLQTIVLRHDDIQEFDSKWDGILLSMTKNPIWWHLGRNVQTKNARIWETQERIGIVRPGDSSEDSRTWLSQIEDDGEKKYRAQFTTQEFWRQIWKLWNKRRGQQSGDKTAWTKKSRRLLAVES